MFDIEISKTNSIKLIFLSIFMIFLAGFFFGGSYYVLDVVDTQLQTVECTIDNNVYVSDCQELFQLSFYPVLALRSYLVWFSYFFVFALVISMLLVGYRAGRSPALFGFLIFIMIGLTYLGIEVSNMYRTLLENDIFRTMMMDFTVYNKIMLYFPWFIFIVSLFSFLLSIVNWQKPILNEDKMINDY